MHRANSVIVFLLVLAFSSIAIADVGYPTSRLLKLQSSEEPKMAHIRCEPLDIETLKCNRIELSVSTPIALDDEALFAQVQKDMELPSASGSFTQMCERLLPEIPASRDEFREKMLRESQDDFTKKERLLNWAMDGLLSTRQLCENGLSIGNMVSHIKKQQELDEVACSFDWMPDYEKIYSLDKANQQWTYTLDSVGLCGRQITTENLREIPAAVGRSFELEILNLYPDMAETPSCELGVKPKPKKQVFSEQPTKYLKECLFIKVD